MTPAQLVALAHPCRIGAETAHPRFRFLRPDGLSIVLTINSGYE